jgi:hypothetical protein
MAAGTSARAVGERRITRVLFAFVADWLWNQLAVPVSYAVRENLTIGTTSTSGWRVNQE